MAERITTDILASLPKRGRVKKPARYSSEIAEAAHAALTDPHALFAVPATREKAQSVRQGLYGAAKEAGVKVRTWALHDAAQPRELVAYRVISAAAEDGGLDDDGEGGEPAAADEDELQGAPA